MKTRKDYGSNIPEARERLLSVADGMERYAPNSAAEIRDIVARFMHRTVNDRPTPIKHYPVSASQTREIIHLLNTTDMSLQEIAERVGVNAGRVSEIKNGI